VEEEEADVLPEAGPEGGWLAMERHAARKRAASSPSQRAESETTEGQSSSSARELPTALFTSNWAQSFVSLAVYLTGMLLAAEARTAGEPEGARLRSSCQLPSGSLS